MSYFPSRVPVPRKAFANNLLDWYVRTRRSLPWRDDLDPYRVWVSEIMLQQTTVKAVLPYFTAFLEAFPDVRALASASEEEVLARWAGLGYYSRARNLLRTARIIVSDYGGRFPADYRSLMAFPGIGRYTAGAILSIAFGLPYPVLDGNVARVFSRYLGFRGPWAAAPARALWGLLTALVSAPVLRGRVADFNQSIMELGACVCTPRNPECDNCPIAPGCVARRLGRQNEIPAKKQARPALVVDFTVALVRDGKLVLLRPTQSEPFPRDLWELPRVIGRPDERIQDRFAAETGLVLETTGSLGHVVHGITHHTLHIHVIGARLTSNPPAEGFRWIEPASREVGISAYVRKVLKQASSSRYRAAGARAAGFKQTRQKNDA